MVICLPLPASLEDGWVFEVGYLSVSMLARCGWGVISIRLLFNYPYAASSIVVTDITIDGVVLLHLVPTSDEL